MTMPEEEVQRALGRIEGKMDALLLTLQQHIKDDERQFDAIEIRMSRVERKIYWFSGAWAAAGAMVAYFLKPHV